MWCHNVRCGLVSMIDRYTVLDKCAHTLGTTMMVPLPIAGLVVQRISR